MSWYAFILVIIGVVGLLLANGVIPAFYRDEEKSNEWMRKLGPMTKVVSLILLLLGLFRLTAGFLWQIDDTELYAAEVSREINSVSPRLVGDSTKLLGSSYSGKIVHIKYSIVGVDSNLIDPQEVNSQASETLNASYCSIKGMLPNMRNGMGINIVFVTEEGNEITRFWINKQSCEKTLTNG